MAGAGRRRRRACRPASGGTGTGTGWRRRPPWRMKLRGVWGAEVFWGVLWRTLGQSVDGLTLRRCEQVLDFVMIYCWVRAGQMARWARADRRLERKFRKSPEKSFRSRHLTSCGPIKSDRTTRLSVTKKKITRSWLNSLQFAHLLSSNGV